MSKVNNIKLKDLVNIGLSNHEALIYVTLVEEGSLSVAQLATKINVFPNALYRLLIKLEDKGLITATGKHPAVFTAIMPSIAIDNYLNNKIAELVKFRNAYIKKDFKLPKNIQTRVDLIKGQRDFFQTYCRLSKLAQNEILIISIGEEVPKDVAVANRDVLNRDIKIKFIVHKYDNENRDLLIAWTKMGLEVRHFPDWGFHLVVFDRNNSLVSVNNPKNTSERIAFVIYSQGLAKAHADYFYSVWEKAKEVE